MPHDRMLDLLIVGAGPVGLTLACAAHRAGLSVRIIDKAPEPSDKSKALAIWSGTLEALAGLGIVEPFLRQGLEVHAMRLFDKGRELGHVHPYTGVDSPYPKPIFLPQSVTERLLRDHLETLGICVERGLELTDLTQSPADVVCSATGPQGRVQEITARYVAGCDGARSIVRHRIGAAFEGLTVETNFILMDARIDTPAEHPEAMINWSDTGPIFLFPVSSGVWRIFTTRKDLNDTGTPTLQEFREALDRAGWSRLNPRDPSWLSAFRVNERVVDRMSHGRVFLCGDAAHIHSPAGGQGMNTGMQDACNLGWKLGLLARSQGDAGLITSSYASERRPVAQAVVAGSGRLLRASLESNPIFRAFRDSAVAALTRLPAFQRFVSMQLSELGIGYDDSPLIAQDHRWPTGTEGFAPGTRPRDAAVQRAGNTTISLWASALHHDYTLLFFSADLPAKRARERFDSLTTRARTMRPEAKALWIAPHYQPHGQPLDDVTTLHIRDLSKQAHKRFGLHDQPGWYLLRPDQYLAARSIHDDDLPAALSPVAQRSEQSR